MWYSCPVWGQLFPSDVQGLVIWMHIYLLVTSRHRIYSVEKRAKNDCMVAAIVWRMLSYNENVYPSERQHSISHYIPPSKCRSVTVHEAQFTRLDFSSWASALMT